jgi:Ca-activated chloride channel family protein
MVERLDGDRIGLVPFAGASYLLCPMTIDYPAFVMTLQDVNVGLIPRGGTAIEDALRTAIDSFGETTGQADRVIVLITDGDDHEGNPLDLIETLNQRDIRVYTVGVGTTEGDLIPLDDAPGTGRDGFLRDRDGEVVKTSLNEDLLTRLALETGGSYLRAVSGNFGLDRLLDREFARLERDEADARMAKRFQDQAGWFLGLAFALFAAEAAWRERNRAT